MPKNNVNCLSCKHVEILDEELKIVKCTNPKDSNVFIDKAGIDMGKVYYPSRYVSHFVWDCDNFESIK